MFTADRIQYISSTSISSLYPCITGADGKTYESTLPVFVNLLTESPMADDELTIQPRIAFRSLGIWLLIICAEIIHGILRAAFLVPIVGEFSSNQIGVFTGSAIILLISYFTIRWIGAKQTPQLLLVGVIWLLMTVAFEALFGHFVIGLTWERIRADYNVLNGGLMPIGLLLLFFSPVLAAKLRGNG